MSKKYWFESHSIDVEEDLAVEEVRDLWAQMQPAVANADPVENTDGSVTFKVRAGTKG